LAFHSEVWAAGSNWNLSAGSTPRVTRVTGSTDAFKAPDGTFTANALSPTSGNVSHQFFSNSPTEITYTSGTIYTQSAFFKAGTGDAGRYVQLTFGSPQFTQVGYANFDLQVGAVVASGGTADANRNARIENYSNGWYRCAFTATCNASGTTNGVFAALITASGASRAPSFSGTVTDVLYGWGAQLETGSVATSYIPTTTAAVTRNADVVNVTGAVSGSIGQTEGTIYWEGAVNSFDKIFLSLTSGTSNSHVLRMQTSSAGLMQFVVVSGGTQAIIATSGSITLGQFYKVAVAYKQDDFIFYLNGTKIGEDTGGTIPTPLTQIQFSNAGATDLNNQRCRAVALYSTRLTDSELAALTT
jgi:hypothetical protein